MTTEADTETTDVVTRAEGGPLVLRRSTVSAAEVMFAGIPEAGSEGMDAILEAIFAAEGPAQYDAPWQTSSIADWEGVRLRALDLRRGESTYEGGLDWFLIVDAAIVATGQKITFITGAVAVVAQLIKWWSDGQPTYDFTPRSRPSRQAGHGKFFYLESAR